MQIKRLDALQVYDSRGNPTVEAIVLLEDGTTGRAIAPSGASTGRHEARELRDGDPRRCGGTSVHRAVENVRGEISEMLRGCDVEAQSDIDGRLIALDGTSDKSRLGANAILAASMACCVAAANGRRQPLFEHLGRGRGTLLPLPEIQIIGGGAHAAQAIDVQDFLIMPVGARCYGECLEIAREVYRAAASVLRQRGMLAGVADEGGFWPLVAANEQAFEILLRAIELAGFVPGTEVALSLDFAATNLFRDGRYHFFSEGRSFTRDEFVALVLEWTASYPIASVEDPLAEDDWEGWSHFAAEAGDRLQIIGDDLFATDASRIERGIAAAAANAALIKPNQVGTVTETIKAVARTQEAGWLPVISARSGETEDAFIAHLAVALNAGQLKVGSFSRSERMVKWNEVLRIERHLGSRARFLGGSLFNRPPR